MNGAPGIYACCSAALVACFLLPLCGCENAENLASMVHDLEQKVAQRSQEVAAAKEQLWRIEAQAESLAAETTLLRSPGGPAADEALNEDADAQRLAFDELSSVWNRRSESLAKQTLVESTTAGAVALSKASRSALDSVPGRTYDAERTHRTRLEDVKIQQESPLWSLLVSMFTRDFLLVWVTSFGAFLLVWFIVRHDFRHRIRARCRAIVNGQWLGVVTKPGAFSGFLRQNWFWAAAAAGAVVAMVSLRASHPSDTELLRRHNDRLAARLQTLDKELAGLRQRSKNVEGEAERQQADRLYAAHIDGAAQALLGPVDESFHEALAESARRARNQVRKDAESMAVARRAGKELDAHAELAEVHDTVLASFEDAATSHPRNILLVKATLTVIFIGLNFGLIANWRRSRKQADRAISHVCPRCLDEGKLEPISSESSGVESQDRAMLECQTCHYKIDPAYRDMLRLRIPTVGYTDSGKTVWLTMFHRYAEQGRADTKLAKFDRAPSPGETDEEYADILRGLVEQHVGPAPTQIEPGPRPRLREPLLFHFSDAEPLFPSNGIINLFDLAGTISSPEFRNSELQDHAYRMTDGFLYFIDPNRTDEKYLSAQREQLSMFSEELRQKRGIVYGKPLDVPIAVCISKLDMLFRPGEAGSGSYQEFIDRLDPGTRDRAPSLREIRRRHEVLASFREQLFPGWDIEEQFQKLVGGRYLFFPMSAAGFTGVTGHDPKDWNFKPFGIIEPMAWLLHMNGFKTL